MRHPLPVVVAAAVCAVVAGYRSYAAIAEWVADAPAATALALGIAPDRRPSEVMIRRLLQAIDPDLLTTVVGGWVESRTATPPVSKAIAVDGKPCAGSRTTSTAARHVMAACDQVTGVVRASIDVGVKTNEITRFAPLLDQIGDLRNTNRVRDVTYDEDRSQIRTGDVKRASGAGAVRHIEPLLTETERWPPEPARSHPVPTPIPG